MMDTLYIVIPAYNEEETIESVVIEWHDIVANVSGDSKLVVIDDGSKDSTYKKLLELQKKYTQLVPITKQNEGHGATLLYGYHYALAHNADYIFQTDSDGQTLPSEFELFWRQREQYDVIIGFRNQREDGISRIFVTKTLKLVLFLIFGVSITDANTPFRLMKRDLLQKYLPYVPEKFNLSNVMLSVLFVKQHEKVKFEPITFKKRQGGVNSINLRKIFKIGLQAVKDFGVIKKEMRSL